MAIAFYEQIPTALKDRRRLKKFLTHLFQEEKQIIESLSIIFCSDPYLLEINRNFLNHDTLTDIITFNLSSTESIQGEIYISIDRIRENALMHRTAINDELHRVIFHGALHLCGYEDKSKKNIVVMRSKEAYYLSTYFNVPRGT